jgi:hypothetical protein
LKLYFYIQTEEQNFTHTVRLYQRVKSFRKGWPGVVSILNIEYILELTAADFYQLVKTMELLIQWGTDMLTIREHYIQSSPHTAPLRMR